MSADTVISFAPAPRAMWILFHEGDLEEPCTFALMPGWMTLDSDGFRWVTLTWMNALGPEVAPIDGDTATVMHVWDSANGRPTKSDVLKATKRTGQTEDARSEVSRYYDEVMGIPTDDALNASEEGGSR